MGRHKKNVEEVSETVTNKVTEEIVEVEEEKVVSDPKVCSCRAGKDGKTIVCEKHKGRTY